MNEMNFSAQNNSLLESQEITLKLLILRTKEWFNYLLSKWLIMYANSKQPKYSAVTTFVIEEGSSSSGALGALGGLASIAGFDMGGNGGGIFEGDNILQLYKSRNMIEKTLLSEVEFNNKKLLLVDRYIEFNKLREIWAKKQNLKNIKFNNKAAFTRVQDSVLSSITKDINLNYLKVSKLDKKLSIISTEVIASDEFFAKAFNDQIVKNVNDFYVQTKTKKSLENVSILQQKVDSVRSVLYGAIYTGAVALDATPNLNPTRQIQRVVPIQRSQFASEANSEILKELVKNLELSKIALRKETPLIQVIDEPIYPLDKLQLSKIKGIIVGGILAGFFICIFFVTRKIYKNILAS
jgi:hypothetical protein